MLFRSSPAAAGGLLSVTPIILAPGVIHVISRLHAQHASDMIEWWNPELLVRKPDWLARNAATKFRMTWNGSRW